MEMLRRHDAGIGADLADEAEGAHLLPGVLTGLVHVDRDARLDRLDDIGIDHAADEAADDDGVGGLRDGDLHRAGRRGLDVVLVDRNVVEVDTEQLRRVIGALVERREERVVERTRDEGDPYRLLVLGLRDVLADKRRACEHQSERGGAEPQGAASLQGKIGCHGVPPGCGPSRKILLVGVSIAHTPDDDPIRLLLCQRRTLKL